MTSLPRLAVIASIVAAASMAQAQEQPPSLKNYDQWKLALKGGAAPNAAKLWAAPGFRVELVREAAPSEGSWISLALDPRGRFVVGREDRGLLRMTLADDFHSIKSVEQIDDTLLECRGLLFAHDSLYAFANDSRALYRLRDTDRDDRFDRVELLKTLPGGVGHGRNSLALGPDGMVYMAMGNNVQVPEVYERSTSPYRNFGLDRLLPCVWNEFLFDANVVPPAGFIARTDPAGRTWQLVAGGFRNPYGLAFDAEGELFTYDADMEWDAGAPWYRPTRVSHVVAGGEYGWRQGTSVWPDHFDDMLPGVVDIGLGSPTGVIFGTRGRFPQPYRRALFILDWAYGRILALHLEPRGATYGARVEPFVTGRPLNVTGVDFGPDGAMYFTVGGRGTRSALYRVSYVGSQTVESTTEPAADSAEAHLRKTRRQLERLQAEDRDETIKNIWQHLASSDRWIRSAARVALEHQPLAAWQSRALKETQPLAASTACLGLARLATSDVQPRLSGRLRQLLGDSHWSDQRLVALRATELMLIRMGPLPTEEAAQLAALCQRLYPAGTWAENQLLCDLLVYLHTAGHTAPALISTTLGLLDSAGNQEEKLFYLFALRGVERGWTLHERRRYFEWLARAEHFRGAHYMARFVTFIRTDALASLSPSEHRELEPLIERLGRPSAPPPAVLNRPLIKIWKLDELEPLLGEVGRHRNFAAGQAAFSAALCVHCHRFGNQGAAVGPDLTAIAARFSRRDMLEAILRPSKVVEEKYRSMVIETDDGRIFIGQIAGGDKTTLAISTDPSRPTALVRIARHLITTRTSSRASNMPDGLLNILSRDEILDLLAFLESGGDPRHPDFQR